MRLTLKILLITLFFTINRAYGQVDFGFGAAGSFNWIHGGVGTEARARVGLNQRWSIVPQFNYSSLFTINVLVREWYAGSTINYAFIKKGNWDVEAVAGAFYSRWPNYANYNTNRAQPQSFVLEIGGALVKNTGCVRPFAEHRYSLKWQDATTRIGFYAMLVGCKERHGGRPRSVLSCPRMTDF